MMLSACNTQAESSPAPSAPVVDKADILPEGAEMQLNAKLTGIWRDTRTAIVVATVPTLEGKSIDQAAYDMYNSWGIGDRRTNRGLLILVAPTERKVRIEVGCGMESIITNPVAKKVIDQEMIPGFRRDDAPGAINAGVDALAAEIAHGRDTGPVSPACTAMMKKAA
ncbi:MAG: TPM domain-containing protein [Sphingomonadales bacterium]|nr:TPM domain-containing protein [Sphingomonadales bacterium]MBD3772534.1 TPM domain-containing protein [Paracoccaceae bacterium]